MPLNFVKVVKVKVPKTRVGSQDVLQITSSVVSLTKELTNLSFFPPATAAVGIVLLMLQTIQGIQVCAILYRYQEACPNRTSTEQQGRLLPVGTPMASDTEISTRSPRLARRCARILLDINGQMEGRWDTAPPTLLKNLERFQRTLKSIHEFMKHQNDISWTKRFIRKSSIELAIGEFSAELDDAAQSFQIATLIDIHYALSPSRSATKQIESERSLTLPPPPYLSSSEGSIVEIDEVDTESIVVASPLDMNASFTSTITTTSATEESTSISTRSSADSDADYEIISDQVLEDRGFRRYHQSEVRLKGRSKMHDGWWAGVSSAEADGRQTLIKRYDGPHAEACARWMKDVQFLQDVYHPNLPEMLGFSAEGAPTPFILLSNIQTRSPQNMLLNELTTRGVASCAQMILKFYEDVVDATVYVQRQHSLNESQTQDFVGDASYRIDGFPKVVMGLPPAKDGVWVSARNYNLTESINMAIMKMLPQAQALKLLKNSGIDADEATRRLSHLIFLLRGLLPEKKDPISLSSRAKALIGSSDDSNEDDEADELDNAFELALPRVSLRDLRLSNLQAGRHDFCWHENSNIKAHRFTVGDYGIRPKDSKDFGDFVILGNVLKENLTTTPLEQNTRGTCWNWKDFPMRRMEVGPFSLPPDVKCWPMAVPPNQQIDCQVSQWSSFQNLADGWRCLLAEAKALASKHDVKPEDIILITGAGTDQDFYIKDFRSPTPHFNANVQRGGHFGQPQFGHQRPGFGHPHGGMQQHHMFHHQPTLPTIFYLMTSPNPDFEPYWSHQPNPIVTPSARPSLDRGWTYRIGWCTGFIHWIQLHKEDFIE